MLEEKSHTSSLLCVAERIFQVRNDRVTQRRRRRWVHPVHGGIYVYTVVVGAVPRVNERCRKLTLHRTDFRQNRSVPNDNGTLLEREIPLTRSAAV